MPVVPFEQTIDEVRRIFKSQQNPVEKVVQLKAILDFAREEVAHFWSLYGTQREVQMALEQMHERDNKFIIL